MNNRNLIFHRLTRWSLLIMILLAAVARLIYDEIEFNGVSYDRLLVWLVGIYVASEIIWLYSDYQQHKQPLKAVDPDVDYTFMHHINQVTIPTMRYRLTSIFHKG